MYRRVLPLLLTAVLLLSGCTAGQKNMPQKMDEKEMTGQPSDMSGLFEDFPSDQRQDIITNLRGFLDSLGIYTHE